MRKSGRPTKYRYITKETTKKFLSRCVDEWDSKTCKYTRVNLPTIEGFAEFLGVSRDTLYTWAKIRPECREALQTIKTAQFRRLVNNGILGRYKPWLVILLLKMNHGMGRRKKSPPEENLGRFFKMQK